MRIMGLKDSVHWFTWFILCSTVMMLTAFLLVILLKVTIHSEHHALRKGVDEMETKNDRIDIDFSLIVWKNYPIFQFFGVNFIFCILHVCNNQSMLFTQCLFQSSESCRLWYEFVKQTYMIDMNFYSRSWNSLFSALFTVHCAD